MSGGHFDYACGHVSRFADELEIELNNPNDELLTPEIKSKLYQILGIVQKTAFLMKETEWLFSGDTGEDSFLKDVTSVINQIHGNFHIHVTD